MNFTSDDVVGFLKNNFFVVGLLCGGLIFLGIGLIQMMGQQQSEIEFTSGEDVKAEQIKATTVFVDVSGAVNKPGIYELASDARINEALNAAGGMAENVDTHYVARIINLAQPVTDGMKIYIPPQGESPSDSSSTTEKSSDITSGLININSADMNTLDALPGVGEVTAQKIIDNRPYSSVDELLTKKAVNSRQLEQIKDKISVY